MNSIQKLILASIILTLILMMLFPPFHILLRDVEMNMGYGFLFSPPTKRNIVASVDVQVLLVQWVLVGLVGFGVWLLTKNIETSDIKTPRKRRERNSDNKSFTEKMSFILLRLIRAIAGLIFGWQIIGLFPALTWFSDISAITLDMYAMLSIKLLVLIWTGVMFFVLRKLINRLHNYWYGLPHPSLSKKMSL